MKNFTNNLKQFTSRLSARWLIMALMMLAGTSSLWAANKRIYYLNTNDWNQVKCYAWNSNGNNVWPGATMTKGTDGFYYCDINESYTSIIFNCGSNSCQTSDLNIDFNKPYYAEGKWYSNLEEYYTPKGYIYFNAGDCIYMKNFKPSGWGSYWIDADDHYGYAEIGGTKYQFEYSSGTKNQDAYYKATITNAGWYKTVIFHRGSNVNTIWNSSGSIQLTSQGNCYYGWTVGGTNAKYETYTPPANAGFWGADAWNIKYYPGSGNDKWIDDNIFGHIEANGTAELGTLTGRPYLKGILANVYWTQNVSNVCGLEVTFKDADNTTQSITTFVWRDIDGDNIDKELKTESLNIPLPYSSGNHTVTFTFKATINNNGTSCDSGTETTTMTGTIKYEIPECSVPDGITIKYADDEKFCANSNVTLSPSVEHVDGYTYAWEVLSGAGWSINSGSAARECEVKVGTAAGRVKLTVSNATCSKEATTLDITPKASNTIDTPTISATKQIICNGNNDAFLSVGGLTDGATYTLVFEGSEQAEPAPIPYPGSEEVKFAISKAGSYTVVAKTTDTEACQFTARATNEIDFTSISFSQSEYITTPWVPVSVVVNAPEGTTYEYDDTTITGTPVLKDAPIKTVSNNTYTYKLPRPKAWGEGNKTPANADVNFTVSAKITVNTETCEIESTVKLQDEGNDKCTTTNP